MKRNESTNAPGRPAYEGQYIVFHSPHHREALLVDMAERDRYGNLNWVAVNDEVKIQAALKAYHAIKAGVADPHVRTSVLRQYAVNLMLRSIQHIIGPERFDNLAEGIAVSLQNVHAGPKAIPFAIEHGLEVERPCLAEIERMLARGSMLVVSTGGQETTTLPRSALGILESLRAGRDPSGGMFPVKEQLAALQLQYPVLKCVELSPPEPALSLDNNGPTL